MAKIKFKDIINVAITEARKSVTECTDKQIGYLVEKLSKLTTLVVNESNKRYAAALEAEVDQEIEDKLYFEDDEVQEHA